MRLSVLFFITIFFGCKSSKKTLELSNLGLFSIDKRIDDNSILLSKKKFILKNHGEIEKEKSYSLVVPNTLKRISSTVSKIPSENLLEFKKNQKVLILGNDKKLNIKKYAISKEQFLSEIRKGYFSKNINNIKLKKGRYFGISTNDNYILMYLNVEEKNTLIFNEILKSQNINYKVK